MKTAYYKIILLLVLVLGLLLRIYNVSGNPPSLYWDEVSLGYNAYSILTSFKDEHGEVLPLDRFIAFGDFKPPGYIYLTVPSVFLFGLNEFSVRLPSVLSGVFIIFFVYLTTYELLKNRKVGLIAAFLVAVSSWAIQLSRGAFEANVASLLSLIGFYMFLKISSKRLYLMPLSFIFFILSFYTFNANRIIAPLILLFLFIYRLKEVIKFPKTIILSIIVSLILLVPSYNYLKSPESKIRFQEVSIFNNLEVLKTSNQRIAVHDNSLLSRVLYNRRVAYFKEFLDHFFDHFNADYLYTTGDRNPRLSSQVTGIFFFFEALFLLTGGLFIFRKKSKVGFLLITTIVISLIPSSLAKETPHALRTVTSLPFFYIIMGFGLYYVYLFLKKYLTKQIAILFSISYLLILVYYLHILFISYPFEWAGEWQYGYKEAVRSTIEKEDRYDYVVVTEAYGRPYIYWLFYNQIHPDEYLKTRIASRDWFGFWDVDGFSKYRFGTDQLAGLNGKILFVGTPSEAGELGITVDTISGLDGIPIFTIAELKK